MSPASRWLDHAVDKALEAFDMTLPLRWDGDEERSHARIVFAAHVRERLAQVAQVIACDLHSEEP